MIRKLLYSILSITAIGFYGSAASFVTHEGAIPGALTGRVIAVAPSHGRYYEQSLDRWEWQRGRLHSTVEDLFSMSFVNPFLTPMLENAGAYVVMPRERDTSTIELIIDPDGEYAIHGYQETPAHKADKKHKWKDGGTGFGHIKAEITQGHNPFRAGAVRENLATTDRDKASTAQWRAEVPATGEYAVYVSYKSLPNSCPEVHYTVHTASGPEHFTIDQRKGGGTWVYLGTFPFNGGESELPLVELATLSDGVGVITADAVKIGGGMGNVARRSPGGGTYVGHDGEISGMPRYAEAARYWLQWAGMPDSVYSNTAGESDYKDDMFARPMWVNYLKNELGVLVDLLVSFHTDAGLTETPDETVGTMGIYYTNRGRKFPDGRSRLLNRALADSIVSSVTRDIQSLYDPGWNRRKMRDKSYVEIRIPEVPSMLIELLSHQNYADMVYGLDPAFKFTVGRAVYKGILSYLSARKLTRYIVQPLPVSQFAIRRKIHGSSPAQLTLSWQPTPDRLEPTAFPTSYIIEERIGGDEAPFHFLAKTSSTEFDVEITPGQIHSYRVVAVNGGGRSFDSEVLSAGYSVRSATDWITVVNGFTRVSGPDAFFSGQYAGFGLRDPGVPWGTDWYATGRVHEYDRFQPWRDDDDPGFGASGWELEGKGIRGNNFDFTVIHGEAILACGRSFISSSAEAFCLDTLSTPPIVDLMLGLQRTGHSGNFAVFSPQIQRRLLDLSEQGTNIMVSGAYIGSDLTSESQKNFAKKVLGYSPRGQVFGAPTGVTEVPSPYFSSFGGGIFTFSPEPDAEPYRITGADAITASDGVNSAVIMRYDSCRMPAAVAYQSGVHGAVSVGFPFETVKGSESRRKLMNQILSFFKNNVANNKTQR